MTLSVGSRLGPFEILSPAGAGGMGEVYRARDTRLGRDVAIKILPETLAATPESRERFEREARAVSSLNHPHICMLYDVGHQDSTDFLVMEYLEGETLAQRLGKGLLPVADILRIAIQIADALDNSHRHGVVHRDLKPGNIMLTKSGAKLLDFGLAKAAAPLSADLSSSPTVTSPLATPVTAQPLTAAGSMVGTFQYMSPEQIEGREADSRSDIFSFGAVLYEMATGKKAFEAKSQASLIAAILEHEPEPISAVRPMIPAALDRLVRTSLSKNPDDRVQSAHDLKLQLEWIRDAGSQAGAPSVAPPSRSSSRTWLAVAAGAAVLILLAVIATLHFSARPALDAGTVRFTIPPPEKSFYEMSLAISPNGRLLAFVADSGGNQLLWVRPLDSLDAHALNGTDGATLPFWSPNSRSIGFFAAGKLKKIDLSTGTIQSLCDVPDSRGGSWGADGTILYAPGTNLSLYRLPADGGTPAVATTLDRSKGETSHRWPYFLPDGRHFLYFARTGGKRTEGIYVGSLDSPERQQVLESDSAVAYAAPGYLFFVRARTLFAQQFDATRLRLSGPAFPVGEAIEPIGEIGPSSYAPFSVSQNGVLVFRTDISDLSQLTWFDRHGKPLGTIGPPGLYDETILSPDAKHIALDGTDPDLASGDIYLLDLSNGSFSRFTFEPSTEISSVWSPDGSRLVFASNRSGNYNLYSKPANGSANEEPLFPSQGVQLPDDWSPDGKYVIFDSGGSSTEYNLWVLPMFGDRRPRPFYKAPGMQQFAVISPDGRWVAYESSETGRYEIFVQSFPAPGGKWQITNEGGLQPRWRRDGRELFYVAPDKKIMAVPTQLTPTFHAGAPQELFEAPISMKGILDSRARYLPMPDGNRFLVVKDLAQGGASSPVHVVLDWPAALQTNSPQK